MPISKAAAWLAAMRSPRRVLFALTLVLIASLPVAALYRASTRQELEDTGPRIAVDFARPDVLVRTQSLSAFFRDLLKIPIARDLFGEDLAFYYELHPSRLGLAGTLRRIAYEHDLTWSDRMVASVFDEPAEILLWRGPKGSLEYWAMAMSRGTLATVVQQAATVVASDRQLARFGDIEVDGTSVQVYALTFGSDQTLLITSHRDRVVVLSHAGILQDANESADEARQAVGRLLSTDPRARAVFAPTFPAGPGDAVHSVQTRLHFASFGYQRFFPGVEALGFQFGHGSWSTSMLLDSAALSNSATGSALGDRALWTAVPGNAALCTMLPVDWSQGRAILARAGQRSGAARLPIDDLAQELEGPAVVCWYEDGRIHTPLVAATLKQPRADLEPLFTGLFEWSVKGAAETPALTIARPAADEALWQRQLEVPYSALDESKRPTPGPLTITLGAKDRHIFFSPDATQVTRALATVAKRYPSMADLLPPDSATLAVVAPRPLASLARQEALVMLPPPDEPVFRAAAEQHLLPRLERMARYPAYRLALPPQPSSGRRWTMVTWQELAR
jgi:uncharacterized protein YfaA (DUF2138 family)